MKFLEYAKEYILWGQMTLYSHKKIPEAVKIKWNPLLTMVCSVCAYYLIQQLHLRLSYVSKSCLFKQKAHMSTQYVKISKIN